MIINNVRPNNNMTTPNHMSASLICLNSIEPITIFSVFTVNFMSVPLAADARLINATHLPDTVRPA